MYGIRLSIGESEIGTAHELVSEFADATMSSRCSASAKGTHHLTSAHGWHSKVLDSLLVIMECCTSST